MPLHLNVNLVSSPDMEAKKVSFYTFLTPNRCWFLGATSVDLVQSLPLEFPSDAVSLGDVTISGTAHALRDMRT